ncbi:hypothetical protein HaLaN_01858 [Haematococcus lacustris]|uniref:Uncharacterized protein n=1 Tax=Haematococcus lacustris TaxID=44745 RepID=A0A699YAM1_HAELA|nr:hypothetical protein HaLaN_01858 [Haematococcus lacustris]
MSKQPMTPGIALRPRDMSDNHATCPPPAAQEKGKAGGISGQYEYTMCGPPLPPPPWFSGLCMKACSPPPP